MSNKLLFSLLVLFILFLSCACEVRKATGPRTKYQIFVDVTTITCDRMEIAEHGIDLYDCDNGARVIRSAANIIEVRK